MSAPRIAVVGGGLAGMAAALDCADAGAQVTLIERRRRLGGATWSFRHNGLSYDNGQHVFLRCCTAYRSFLERLGVSDRVRLQSRLDLPVVAPGGRTARLRRGRLPAPLHLGRSLLTYRHLGLRDRLRLGPAALSLRRVDIDDPETDGQTFGDWLAGHGQSPRAVESLWDLICRPTVNLPASEASLTLAAMVFQTGLLSDSGASDIGWASVPLGELHGDAGLDALQRAGVEVLAGAPVTAVARSSPASGRRPTRGADGNFAVTVGNSERIADAVIVAVPHTSLGAIPGLPVLDDVVEALGTSPIVNVHVIYDRAVTHHEMAAGVGSDVQFVFDRTKAVGIGSAHGAPFDGGQCLAVSLSAADDEMAQSSDEVKARVVSGLGELFPRARHAHVVDALVSREPTATFRGRPGSRRARLPNETAMPGLVLAGAWTDTGWPATMEGAVRSGHTAARHALLAAGQTRNIPEEVVA